MATHKEEITKLLTGLDPLQISDLYEKASESLKDAPPEILGLKATPEDHIKETEFLTENQLVTMIPKQNDDSFLTPEQRQLLMPDIDTKELLGTGAATLSTTPTDVQQVIKENHDAVMKELPHFTSGLNHAQTMALAEEVKETLIHKSKTDTTLYNQFDDTLTKLFEEIKNNDVLSDGQKSALLMKVNMISSNILKESFEVNV